ncbi:MAG: DUF4465 domain-containing protein [Bacteroidetes bacterium]|nr:DUF4465 domain-containing protein [Bacteroidota bacterium]MBV6462457.1 hypothetical protein [Flavobacteriales bacterium]WKZ74376.1 MAG: DUF4465 domain-containing protein [Vicingaceae bacterium]MCL4817003.1 T9SS type A sorting domain-containing protein [Flavobacteriales bacterium]NOG94682.1 DUF4465 domain-containing protein [Bacteroidota bacterium]
MKTLTKITLTSMLLICTTFTQSQTVSTFEENSLAPNSYWNGSSNPMGATFTSGNAIFPNMYDTSWGGFWASGFAYSNMKDSVTPGFANLYAARTAGGYNGSEHYAIAQQNAIIKLNGNAAGKVVNGFFVTNSTYAALSMRDGDMFSKKFGGVSGNDSDWFKLVVRKYYGGNLGSDSVEFYLADYRFSNNAQDYILTTWEWVDLTSLGNADSLVFTLSSSDVGQWGMNTPAFFCMDNFTTADAGVGVAEWKNKAQITFFPNPVTDYLTIDLPQKTKFILQILNNEGKLIYEEKIEGKGATVYLNKLNSGLYFLKIFNGENVYNEKFLKQ